MTFVQAMPDSDETSGHSARPLVERIVDHSAIAHNIGILRAQGDAKLMAVVKADAFGHDAVEVSRTAIAAGAAWLGVATVDEALQLRRAGLEAPILAWLVDPWSDLAAAIRQGVTVSCANVETLRAVTAAAAEVGHRASVHLELDTGMARAGCPAEAWSVLCAAARAAELGGSVRVTGVWSHLALATDPNWSSVEGAYSAFQRGIEVASESGLTPDDIHLANSAATLAHHRTAFTMVRCGASVYGIETVVGRDHGLKYAMRVVARLSQLRRVPAGTKVGYGHTYTTPTETTLGLVPVGYADGVPRALGGIGEVCVGGRRYPIVGAISMDQFSIDLGDAAVRLGDEVVLLGEASSGEPDASEWARLVGTLPHEILTGLGGRMQRRHVRNP